MRIYSFLTAIGILLFVSCTTQSNNDATTTTSPFPKVAPEDAGLHANNFDTINNILQGYVDSNALAGCVAMVLKDGKLVYSESFGHKDAADTELIPKNTIFRLGSMTKPLASLAILMLEDEGLLSTDDFAYQYIPSFKDVKVIDTSNYAITPYNTANCPVKNATQEIKISHLLTHTSGISLPLYDAIAKVLYGPNIPSGPTKANLTLCPTMDTLAQKPLLVNPGEKFLYGLSTEVLGCIVERISGMPLDQFFKTRIFDPLGMTDTYFFLPDDKAARLATQYDNSSNYIIQDTSSGINGIDFPVAGAKTYFSAAGGLCSTAPDYILFLQMVLNDGVASNGTRIIRKKIIQKMKTNQVGDLNVRGNDYLGFTFGFGIDKYRNTEDGYLRLKNRLGWGGYFGTRSWINLDQSMVTVFMCQLYPSNKRTEIFGRFEGLVNTSVE